MPRSYADYQRIAVTVQDRIATVTLNNPDKLNANDALMHAEMASIFTDLELDDSFDVVILTGAGRAFSAGGDTEWMQDAIDDPASFEVTIREAKRIVQSLLSLEKPIIAKVNGHAVGLGATIALFCDIIYAADTARIGDPHVLIGLVAGDGGAVIWPQLIGYARAKEYLMTGTLLQAPEAERIGLINHSVPADDLDATVQEMAERLRDGARKAISWTKVSVNIGLKMMADAVMDASLAYELSSNSSPDHAEAVAAFREKRSPVFGNG